jgi:hypothetical protein
MEGIEARISALTERVGAIKATAEAAHIRMDKMDLLIREDLQIVINDMKEITAWMHRSRGWQSAAMLFAGAIGGALATALSLVFK